MKRRMVLMVIALLLANASLCFSGAAALAYTPSYGLDNVPSYLQPVGGGAGYDATGSYSLTSGPRIWHAGMAGITATTDQCTYTQLQSQISAAHSGDVIFIPGTCSIDFTGQTTIDLPANITVASDRGYAGSKGALLYKTGTESSGYDFFFILFSRYTRLTGLRILNIDGQNNIVQGPSYCGMALEPGASYVEIDNNEIGGFGGAGIYTYGGGDYGSEWGAHDIYIHNNYIHNNYCRGLGYGIAVSKNSSVAIEGNILNASQALVITDGSLGSVIDMSYNQLGPYLSATGDAVNEHAHTGGGASTPDTSGPYVGMVVGGKQLMFHHNLGLLRNATLGLQGGVTINGTFIAYNRLNESDDQTGGSCPWTGWGAGDPGRCAIGQPFGQGFNFGNIFIQNNYITGMWDHPGTYLYPSWTNYWGNISLVAHEVPLTGNMWSPSDNAINPVIFWFPTNFTVKSGSTLSFQVDGMSPIMSAKNISAPLTFSVSGAPTGSSFDAGSQYFSWTPDGSVTGWVGPITFTATDPGGNSTSRATMINVLSFASGAAYPPSIPMDLGTILLIAVALALDCFAVSLACGSGTGLGGMRDSARIAFAFGIFQAGMLLVGWLAGQSVLGVVSDNGYWLASALIAIVGVWMIRGGVAYVNRERTCFPRTSTLLILALMTSIGTLAVGASFAFLTTGILVPCLIVGFSTFGISLLGAAIGGAVSKKWGETIEILGGVVLIAIGIEIVILHLLG